MMVILFIIAAILFHNPSGQCIMIMLALSMGGRRLVGSGRQFGGGGSFGGGGGGSGGGGGASGGW
jgi:uncharacterized protein